MQQLIQLIHKKPPLTVTDLNTQYFVLNALTVWLHIINVLANT